MICDLSKTVNIEEYTLLRFLGANFVDPAKVDEKGRWAISINRGSTSLTADYTINSNDGGELKIDEQRHVKDKSQGFVTSDSETKIDYSGKRLVPGSRSKNTKRRTATRGNRRRVDDDLPDHANPDLRLNGKIASSRGATAAAAPARPLRRRSDAIAAGEGSLRRRACPARYVATICVCIIVSAAAAIQSRSITTKSAYFPGVIEPSTRSWKFACAAQIVIDLNASSRVMRCSGYQPPGGSFASFWREIAAWKVRSVLTVPPARRCRWR